MNYVGIDLHKKTIVTCVLDQDRKVIRRGTFACCQTEEIRGFFTNLRPFQAVVEATASYHWLVELIEPLADRVVLAHPGKLRVIAESDKKTDKHDAYVLAEFLALGKVPEAFRPGPRQRQHRALVRHRRYLRDQITAIKNKVRRIAADYNADRKDLLTAAGLERLAAVGLTEADRFVLGQLWDQWQGLLGQLRAITERLRQFAEAAPPAEAEARAVLGTVPGFGPVTIDVIVSEVGDVRRFGSAKKVCAYAGLVPIVRQSGGKAKDLSITKRGSPLLRWALVEAAWRLVRHGGKWRNIYENIKKRRGGKKAIVAVARRLLCVIVAMLKASQPYRLAAA